MDIIRPQPIAPKATLGTVMGYNKKEQVEMLRAYPPRISRKRVRQSIMMKRMEAGMKTVRLRRCTGQY